MRTGFKTVLALAFVGVVAMAAAAFGQTGDPSATPSPGDKPERARHRVVHSETKVQKGEGFVTVIRDAGEITAVSGNTVTIKRADDETVTVTATDATKVRRNGEQAAAGDLKTGDRAHIVQVVENGTTTVKAIMAADSTFTPERKREHKRRHGPKRGAPADEAPAGDVPAEGAAFFAA